MTEPQLWIRAATARAGRLWKHVGSDDSSAPADWVLSKWAALDQDQPSVVWHRTAEASVIAANGFDGEQTLVLGRPYWSFVLVAARNSHLTTQLAAALMHDAIAESRGVASLISRAIVDVDAGTFSVAADLLTQLERQLERSKQALEHVPPLAAHIGLLQPDAVKQVALRLFNLALGDLDTVAITGRTDALALAGPASIVLTPSGVIEQDPFALPLRQRRTLRKLAQEMIERVRGYAALPFVQETNHGSADSDVCEPARAPAHRALFGWPKRSARTRPPT